MTAEPCLRRAREVVHSLAAATLVRARVSRWACPFLQEVARKRLAELDRAEPASNDIGSDGMPEREPDLRYGLAGGYIRKGGGRGVSVVTGDEEEEGYSRGGPNDSPWGRR